MWRFPLKLVDFFFFFLFFFRALTRASYPWHLRRRRVSLNGETDLPAALAKRNEVPPTLGPSPPHAHVSPHFSPLSFDPLRPLISACGIPLAICVCAA